MVKKLEVLHEREVLSRLYRPDRFSCLRSRVIGDCCGCRVGEIPRARAIAEARGVDRGKVGLHGEGDSVSVRTEGGMLFVDNR